MKVTSAFKEGQKIPSQYTCDGQNETIPVEITDIPTNTKSLVLIMDDPDIPDFVREKYGIKEFDHWIKYDIPPTNLTKGKTGKNSAGQNKYTGPCPPDKEHRYYIKVYALDIMLNLPEGKTKQEVISAMKRHIISEATLMGKYERKKAQE